MSIYKNIKGFVPNSLVDWDGAVCSMIFVANCNFKCGFCHNKELVLEPEKLKPIFFDEIKKYLEKNRDFVDGVVITGGEPCLYDDLPDLCRQIKNLGFMVKVETNGTNPELLNFLLKEKLADFVAMDIKSSFGKYREMAGVDADIEKIKKSIEIVSKFPRYEFRTTLFPKITRQDLIEIAEYLWKEKANKAFFIQQFRAENCIDKEAEKIKPYKEKEIQEFLLAIKNYFEKAGVRNL